MSYKPSASTPQVKLNKLNPAAWEVKLGDIINDLITSANAQRTSFNTLVAKLNADAGVTDTNYAVSGAAAITALNAR